jgi:hypothetical protein
MPPIEEILTTLNTTLQQNNALVAEHIALLKGGAPAAAAPAAGKAPTTPPAEAAKKPAAAKADAKKPTVTPEQVRDTAMALKDKHGAQAVRDIISEHGFGNLKDALAADAAKHAPLHRDLTAKLAEDLPAEDDEAAEEDII